MTITLNVRTVNVIPLTLNTHRAMSIRFRPFGQKKQKKKSGEKESGKLTTTTTNNYLCSMLLNTLEIHLLRNAVAVRSLLERTDKT